MRAGSCVSQADTGGLLAAAVLLLELQRGQPSEGMVSVELRLHRSSSL